MSAVWAGRGARLRPVIAVVWVPLLVVVGAARWSWRHCTWVGCTLVFATSWVVLDVAAMAVVVVLAGWLIPAVASAFWSRCCPVSYERFVAGPWRRHTWRVDVHSRWEQLSQDCGLSTSRLVTKRNVWTGEKTAVRAWQHARLCSVSVTGWTLLLTVRARPGHTSAEVIKASGVFASALGAVTYTARALSPSTASIELVMADYLAGTVDAPDPATMDTRAGIIVGRSQNSGLVTVDPVAGLHLAIQGATRSGKSMLCYSYLSALAYRPDVLVCGVDPTGVLLSPFTVGRGAGWIATTGKDGERVARVLEAIADHMDARITELVADGLDKISQYSPQRPAVTVVLEEWPALLSQLVKDDDAESRKGRDRAGPRVERAVGRIVKEGAKVGITVLVMAQRMSAKAIDTDDRSNIPVRVTMRIDNSDAVRMLHDGVDNSDIEQVRQFPPGRGLVEAPGLPLQKFQADLINYQTYLPRVRAGILSADSPGSFCATPPPIIKPSPTPDPTKTGTGKKPPAQAREMAGAASGAP